MRPWSIISSTSDVLTLLEGRLGIDYDHWLLLDPATRRAIIGACLRKRALTFADSLTVAHRMRDRGEQITKYRCCFCPGYHVGHPPTMAAVAELCLAVRDLHGDRPPRLAKA